MSELRVESWFSRGGGGRGGLAASVSQLLSRAQAACERDEYALALLDLGGVLAQHPDFADVRNQAGFCRAMLGDPEGALEEFGHAVRVNPDYTEAHLNRALVLNELSRFDEASVALERAGELEERHRDPFPVEAGNRIALAHAELGDLYMDVDEPGAAITEYDRALHLRPEFADVRTRLARGLLQTGDVERAVEELTEALERRPSYLQARFLLGLAYRRLGRIDDATSEWRRCLSVDPKNAQITAVLASTEAGLRQADGERRDGRAER